MRVVLAVLGLLVGAALSSSSALVGAILGGFIGFAIAEMSSLRAKIVKLEQEVGRLRRHSAESEPESQASEVAPVAPAPGVAAAPVVVPVAPLQTAPLRGAPSPAVPLPDSALVAAIKRFFTGGNTLVQVGVVVVFFGVAFLLRYLAEHAHVSIEVRLSGIALGAVVLLAVGWRLRRRKTGYAMALQGGGVGILYLTVFAALRVYGLLPPSMAFAVLVLIAALSAALAVMQDSMTFALLGIIGGFLAPVLAASGAGSQVMLFGYYAILNLSIALMAWFKAWRPLNVVGFLFTFAIATAWGVLQYRPEDFPSTEPFLIFFFLLYVAVAALFTLRQPLELRGYVDGPLVFGVPIAAFGLQSAMLRTDSMALAYSALCMSALYLLLTFVMKRRRESSQALLAECFLSLAVAFLTLAIPLALGSRLNSAAWALEGAALVWIGCRQNRRAARLVGTLLMVSAAVLLVGEASYQDGTWLIPPSLFPGVVLVSGACLCSVWNLDRAGSGLRPYEEPYAPGLFVVGLLAWLLGGLGELPHLVSPSHFSASSLGLLSFTAACLSELAQRGKLKRAGITGLLLLPVMYVYFADAIVHRLHPFAAFGGLAWPVAFAVLYLMMYRHEGPPRRHLSNTLHTFAAWLLCLTASWEAGWAAGLAISPGSPEWAQAARLIVPALALLLLPRLVIRAAWPFAMHREIYLSVVGLGLGVGLAAWSLSSDFWFEGNAAPLPYMPFLNPLDLAQAMALMVLLRYWLKLRDGFPEGFAHVKAWTLPALLATLLFLWLNAVLLHSLHHLIGVPLRLEALAASSVVQTCVSILWSMLALSTMLLASRKRLRQVWVVGATLMTIVIIKLFFVDLASVGSIERIVSFLGVGMAMLVVGYFSPLPPRVKES